MCHQFLQESSKSDSDPRPVAGNPIHLHARQGRNWSDEESTRVHRGCVRVVPGERGRGYLQEEKF